MEDDGAIGVMRVGGEVSFSSIVVVACYGGSSLDNCQLMIIELMRWPLLCWW